MDKGKEARETYQTPSDSILCMCGQKEGGNRHVVSSREEEATKESEGGERKENNTREPALVI